jgi:three-Cys-motif partner protein
MVQVAQRFGGGWTRQKLDVVESYLVAYSRVMQKQTSFSTWYFDGFAGSGFIDLSRDPLMEPLLPGQDSVMSGSAKRAMENPRIDFDEYVFVEKDQEKFDSLEALSGEYPDLSKQLVRGDCNAVVLDWAASLDRRTDRAVVFLDPFKLDVNWTTVEALGRSGVVDLWLWFPLWVVNRLLKRDGYPFERHASALERVYGGDAWKRLYHEESVMADFWGEPKREVRRDDRAAVVNLYREQMLSCFHTVSESSDGWFYRPDGTPLYVLLFACANPRGSDVAMKIAKYLLSPEFLRPAAFQGELAI